MMREIVESLKKTVVTSINKEINKRSRNISFKDVIYYPCLLIGNNQSPCGINPEGIEGLDLVKLDAYGNSKITNVTFMKNLKELDDRWSCGISPEGIEGLNLVKLYANGNSKIDNNKN